jgi:hypothetical protein
MPVPPPIVTTPLPMPAPGTDQVAAEERSADARLARLHLRGGLLPLARAALEQMAGAGTLDREAMADLAEVRWRGGDLEGAAEAARAHQAAGGGEPLAALILAEDLMARGQPDAARRYVEYVLARTGSGYEQLFAAEPRSPLWPPADGAWMARGAREPGRMGLLVGGSEVAAPVPETWQPEPVGERPPDEAIGRDVARPTQAGPPARVPMGRGGAAPPGGQASTAAVVLSGRLAGQELEMVERSLGGGDVTGAVGRLGVLLRLEPALAPVILSVADRAAAASPRGGDLAALHLVRGDAFRILGRENEAAAAYRQAHQALTAGPPAKEPT